LNAVHLGFFGNCVGLVHETGTMSPPGE
jgi:hypothetical protein